MPHYLWNVQLASRTAVCWGPPANPHLKNCLSPYQSTRRKFNLLTWSTTTLWHTLLAQRRQRLCALLCPMSHRYPHLRRLCHCRHQCSSYRARLLPSTQRFHRDGVWWSGRQTALRCAVLSCGSCRTRYRCHRRHIRYYFCQCLSSPTLLWRSLPQMLRTRFPDIFLKHPLEYFSKQIIGQQAYCSDHQVSSRYWTLCPFLHKERIK